MKAVTNAILALILVVVMSGCVETTTYVKVKKDGSGTIMLRALFDEEAVAKMASGAGNMMGDVMGEAMGEAMGEMMGEMTIEMGDAFDAEFDDMQQSKSDMKMEIKDGFQEGMGEVTMEMSGPDSFYDEAQCRQLAKAFGESVRFVKGKEIAKGKQKGFEVLYSFDDISKVVVGQEISDTILEASMGEGDNEVYAMAKAYSFEFKKGFISTLSIKPPPTDEEMEAEWKAQASPEELAEYNKAMEEDAEFEMEEDDMGDMNSGMNAQMEKQMEEQMLGAFKSRKDSILVSVDGKVKSSNATYQSKKRPSTLVLLHMDFNEILSTPKGKDLLLNNSEEMSEFVTAAKAANIPGIRVEDPTKTVVVTFK